MLTTGAAAVFMVTKMIIARVAWVGVGVGIAKYISEHNKKREKREKRLKRRRRGNTALSFFTHDKHAG